MSQAPGLRAQRLGRALTSPGPWLALLFCLYALTSMPGLSWRDGPEFAVTTTSLGVAHPSGYPTYSLLSKAAAFLPLGSLPFRLTLFSAVCTLGAVWLVWLTVNRLCRDEQTGRAVALAALLALGISPSVWIGSTHAEVYTLNFFLLMAMVYLGVRWRETPGDAWLMAGAFLYGLAAGNHGSVALYLPGFLLLALAWGGPGRLRRVGMSALFFLLGFSVYLYLPLRSLADPAIDWGNPETLANFLRHITDRKDAGGHFGEIRRGLYFFLPARVFLFQTLPAAAWFSVLPLATLGGFQLWRRGFKALVVAMGYIALVNVLFFITWTDRQAFLPALFYVMVLAAVGLAWVLGPVRAQLGGAAAPALGLVLVIGATWALAAQWQPRDRSGLWLAQEAFLDDYEAQPPEAIDLVMVLWFHHQAYQTVFAARPDLTIINTSEFLKPRYNNFVTQARYPGIHVPGRSYTAFEGLDFLKDLITLNLDAGRRIGWEPSGQDYVFYEHLTPRAGFMFELTPQPVGRVDQATLKPVMTWLEAKLAREWRQEHLAEDHEADTYYIRLISILAGWCRAHRAYPQALEVLNLIERFFGPGGKNTLARGRLNDVDNLRGAILAETGRLDEALGYFERMTRRSRYSTSGWVNLGLAYYALGRYDEAEPALRRALALDPTIPNAQHGLGLILMRRGEKKKALGHLEKARDHARTREQQQKYERAIERLERAGP